MAEETKSNEFLSFKDFTETDEYKDLINNVKIDYPQITEANAKIAIYGWYSQEIQGIPLPEVKKVEPPSGEIVSMDVYSVDEHNKMFPHLIEKEPVIKLIDPLEKGQITNEILS